LGRNIKYNLNGIGALVAVKNENMGVI